MENYNTTYEKEEMIGDTKPLPKQEKCSSEEKKGEYFIERNEIIEHIKKMGKFYEDNIFCVENVVSHTLNFLSRKGFIRLEKVKGTKKKKQKSDIFTK